MADVFFDNPPALQGDEKSQLVQLYRYLNEVSEKLNTALNSITVEQMAPEAQVQIRNAGKEETAQQVNGLKSLIIKTAEIVHAEMDEISTTLQSQYTAISDQFGTLNQSLTAQITANAAGITQNYEYIEQLQAEGTENTANINRFSQYIFTGLVDEVNHKYGIAIGEDITAYDQQGNPHINGARKMATFTMDRLSFWQGETELAYFTDNIFHIANGEVTKTMKMGNHIWKVLADGSMGLISGS